MENNNTEDTDVMDPFKKEKLTKGFLISTLLYTLLFIMVIASFDFYGKAQYDTGYNDATREIYALEENIEKVLTESFSKDLGREVELQYLVSTVNALFKAENGNYYIVYYISDKDGDIEYLNYKPLNEYFDISKLNN